MDKINSHSDHYLNTQQGFRYLIESIGNWIWEVDVQGIFTYSSPAVKNLLGYMPKEIIATSFFELIPKQQAEQVCVFYETLTGKQQAFTALVSTHSHKDGREVILETSGVPIFDGNGNWAGYCGICRDITERKHTEDNLRESNNMFRQITENINEVFWSSSPDGSEIIYISPAFEEIWGRTCTSLYANPEQWIESIHPDDRSRVKQAFRDKLLQNNFDEEYRIVRPDGTERWIRDRAFTIGSATGQVNRVIGIAEDITAQRQVRHFLSEQNELLEQIFDNTHTLIAYLDTNFNFLRANKAYLAADNKKETDIIGRNHFDLYPNEENERIFRKVVETGIPYHAMAKPFEYEYSPEKGVTHWNWSLQPVREDDAVIGVLLVLLDVTEQIKAQEVALQNKKILQKAQEIGHFGGWDWNIVTNELHWTDGVYRIFDLQWSGFDGYTTFLGTIHPNDREEVIEAINRSLAEKIPYDIEHRIIRGDGEIRYVHEKGEIQFDDEGKPLGIKGVVQDITERKLIESELEGYRKNLESLVEARTEELQQSMSLLRRENEVRKHIETSLLQSKEEAERANRLKSEFLGRMSHELRTPLNAILGFGQLLEIENLEKQQGEYVSEILTAGKHLLEMINEVLDLSKIETGGVTLDMQYIPLSEVLADSISMVGSMAKSKAVEIINHVNLNFSPCLYVDHLRFMQVITNILTNAIKYNSSPGTVTIETEYDGKGALSLLISDTGTGIPIDAQETIFEPFNRLGAEYSEIEGTGIGLTIANKLAKMMHCQIGLKSRLGEGSTFWIRCPLVNADTEKSDVDQNDTPRVLLNPAEQSKQIIYIEDNPANLRLVQHVISRLERVTLYSAPNAELGIELACSKKPDLILLDINLPGIDGFEALKVLADLPETSQIPVVAISAAAMPRDIERGLQAGFKRYITKPIQISVLLDVLGEELAIGPATGSNPDDTQDSI